MTKEINTATKYFNLLTDGVGYLNNPRMFGKGKSTGLTITVQALRGELIEGGNIEKSRYDLDVVGKEARRVVEKLMTKYPQILDFHAKDKPTLFIGFRASDTRADSFRKKNSEELINTIKGRLLKIKFVDVNGERLYEAPKDDSELIDVEEEVQADVTPETPVSEAQPEPTESDTPDAKPEAGIDKL